MEVSLGDQITVDLHSARLLARRILTRSPHRDLRAAVAGIPTLSMELLPGWYDDWAVAEAEIWRQLRLHALESLAAILADCGRYGDAATAAGAAIAGDALRESARVAMIRVHLAEGNVSEAIREFERYRRLLRDELGLPPGGGIVGLLQKSCVGDPMSA